jgi:hypothetical protein
MLPLADSRDGTVYLVLDPLRVAAFNIADGRDQAVWPGSRSGGVCNLLSSVIIAVRGRPF